MNTIKKFIIVIFITLAVCSCSSDTEDTAESVGLAFFDALYNQNDIKKTTAL
jgi:hypothetical protein